MTEQSTEQDHTLGTTLQVLAHQAGLTPEELARLRLSDLNLAGKSPNIRFTPEGSDEARTVALDLEAHRALVNWLVARPDSIGDFLFPGVEAEPLEAQEIARLIRKANQAKPTVSKRDAGSAAAASQPEAEGQAGMSGPSRPVPPAPIQEESFPEPTRESSRSRPVPPLSRPEMGAPPPGFRTGDTTNVRPVSPPPPTAPEEDESVNIPLPRSVPKTPPQRPSRPVVPARPTSRPVTPQSKSGPAAPIPRQEEQDRPTQQPRIVRSTPSPTLKKESSSKMTPPTKVPEGGMSPKAVSSAHPPSAEKPQAAPSPPLSGEMESADKPTAAQVSPAAPAVKKPAQAEPSMKKGKLTAQEAATKEVATLSLPRRLVVPGVVAVLLLCAACLGGAAWLASQSEAGSGLLAALGLAGDSVGIEATGEAEAAALESTPALGDSPLPTPTLPPTLTPTPLAPTDTPIPSTDTPTPSPTETPRPTDTPIPTDTVEPTPTETPIAAEPSETPTPESTPTPGLKYGVPVLLEPKDGFDFIRGNTIELGWQPVGELAPDEQYAVRLVYPFNNEITYQGANIKETVWTVPPSLFGQIDPPENRYEWFVVVERLNEDGSGTPISPESERRSFTWK